LRSPNAVVSEKSEEKTAKSFLFSKYFCTFAKHCGTNRTPLGARAAVQDIVGKELSIQILMRFTFK
jgi:hypothetical protein